mgnify:CR=1 FL=1
MRVYRSKTPGERARKIKSIRALHNHVLVCDMNFKEKISHGGIIIPNSDGKLEGVHPRWGRVYSVGSKQQDIREGQYVLVKHGRWSRAAKLTVEDSSVDLRHVDWPDAILLVVSQIPS